MSIVGYSENEIQGDPELVLKNELMIFPDDISLWIELGEHLLDLGRLGEAKEAFLHSMDLNPTNKDVLSILISINDRLGNLKEAKELGFLPSRNFHIIDSAEDIIGGVFTGSIRGLAEGKYTNNKVAIRILISGDSASDESRVVIEGLGEDIAMLPTTLEEMAGQAES